MAVAIELADEERSDAWYIRETAQGLRLMTGRLLAFEIARSKVRVALIGPVPEDARAALGADSQDDEEFRSIPGGLLLTFQAERVPEHQALKDSLGNFIELAIARVRRSSSLEDHAPEAISYMSAALGRDLPQPEPSNDQEAADQADEDGDDVSASREPCVRGRPQLFERGERTISSLVNDIERDAIALPDLQRPFVWEDTRVRDLMDSLFLGFPVGTLVLWHTANEREARSLGAERSSLRATTLVIDGQQRLTSLVAVILGREVLGRDRKPRRLTISFRPRDGRFEVADAAIRQDPEFLPNVTELWTGARQNSQIRRDLLNSLRDKGREVDQKYEDAVETAHLVRSVLASAPRPW